VKEMIGGVPVSALEGTSFFAESLPDVALQVDFVVVEDLVVMYKIVVHICTKPSVAVGVEPCGKIVDGVLEGPAVVQHILPKLIVRGLGLPEAETEGKGENVLVGSDTFQKDVVLVNPPQIFKGYVNRKNAVSTVKKQRDRWLKDNREGPEDRNVAAGLLHNMQGCDTVACVRVELTFGRYALISCRPWHV
jgi:hypothetical protein